MSPSTVSQNEISKPDLNSILSSVLTMLGRLPDVERGITRIFHRTAKATEVRPLSPIKEIQYANRTMKT
jgi:hypothetical protein